MWKSSLKASDSQTLVSGRVRFGWSRLALEMNSLILLAFASGLTCGSLVPGPGLEQVFSYQGRMLTGFPELDTHFSGITLDCQVIVQASENTTFKLGLKNVSYSKFDQKLDGPHLNNWRTLELPSPTPVDMQLHSFLHLPIAFTSVDGKVANIVVSELDLAWSINFKKALVSLLKLHLPPASLADDQDSYKVMEEGVDGICETTYQVSELSDIYISDLKSQGLTGLINNDFCQGENIFQITKIRDSSKCKKVNIYLSSRKMDKDMLTRTSMTKYLACGGNLGSSKLLDVVNEGEIDQNMLSLNTEKLVTGTKQVLRLNEARPIAQPYPAITNPRTIPSLFYDFPHAAPKAPEKSLLAEIKSSSRNFNQDVPLEFLKNEILSKLKTTVMALFEVDDAEGSLKNSHMMSVRQIFPLLSVEELKSIYMDIQKDPTIDEDVRTAMVSLYIDVAILCGHSSSIQFLLYIVQNQQISYPTLLTIAMTIGHNLKVPNLEVLGHLFNIIRSPIIYDNKITRNIALINFAKFTHEACINPSRDLRFPTHIFSDFCSPKSSEITEIYIPYIMNEMRSTADEAYKSACLFALGTMGHQSIPPLLIPYIEGKVQDSNIGLRMISIWSLARSPEAFHEILFPVFSAMFDNPAEDRNVRIASFVMILKMKPSIVFMQKIAASTWNEKDGEIAEFVFSALQSLSQMNLDVGSMKEISVMARTVLPLAKPYPGKIFKAEDVFSNDWLKDLGVGLETTTAFWTNPDGNNFYLKVTDLLGKNQVTPLEMAPSFQGIKTLMDQLRNTVYEALTGKSSSEDPLSLIHSDWKEIIQKLNFTAKRDPPFFGQFYVNIFDDMMALLGVDQTNLEALKQQIKSIMFNPSTMFDKICGRKPINFNKLIDVMPVEALIPSEMGFPIILEIHTPHLISAQGHIDVNCNMDDPKLETSVKFKSTCNNYGLVGTISPLTNEFVVTGVEEQCSINVPIKTVIGMNPGDKKLTLNISPLVNQSTKFVDLISHHINPFTVAKPVTDLTPLVFHPNRKMIHAVEAPTEVTKKLGDAMGFEINYELSTESQIVNGQSVLEELNLYKKNPINMLLFSWTNTAHKLNGLPSIRPHAFRLRYEPIKSENKEIDIEGNLLAGVGQDSHKNEQFSSYVASSHIKVSFLGNSTNIFSLHTKGSFAIDHNEAKWSFDLSTLRNEGKTFSMCSKGSMTQPELPLWNLKVLQQQDISFNFTHDMAFGDGCTEGQTIINAIASVTDHQKEFSEHSAESISCQRTSEHLACHRQLDQTSTLDEVIVTVSGSSVSKIATYYDQYLNIFANGLSWSYIKPSMDSFAADNVIIKFNFDKTMNTVSIELKTPHQSVNYDNIRLPESLSGLTSLVAGKGIAENIYDEETASPFWPTCHLTENPMKIYTFDGRAYHYQLDDCYHVISSDCSSKFTNAVLAKSIGGLKHIKIYHMITKIEIKPSISYTPSNKDYVIQVDGNAYSIHRNMERQFHSADGTTIYVISRSTDDVITVETPDTVVMYDGKHLDVKSKLLRTPGELCGLCGDGNGDSRFDLRTPQGCIYSINNVAALTYRLQDDQCPQLPRIQQEMLANEQKQCIKFGEGEMRPKMVYQPRNCTSWKHSVIRRPGHRGDVCISNDPMKECNQGCSTTSLILKEVNYTCLPFNKSNEEFLEERSISGQNIEEIKECGTPLMLKMQMPSSCA